MMDVNSVVDNICNKLGTTADILVPELVRYKEVDSLSGIIICIIVIIISAILIRIGNKLDEDNDNKIGLYIFGVLGLTVAIPAFIVNLQNYIVWHNAPMGTTVNYIINSLGK